MNNTCEAGGAPCLWGGRFGRVDRLPFAYNCTGSVNGHGVFASHAHDPEASPQVGGMYPEGVTIPATIRNSLGMLAVTV